jgi:hypothetical protein
MGSSAHRIYLTVTSDGQGTRLWKSGSSSSVQVMLEHPLAGPSGQRLTLPIGAIEAASPLIEPVFAHYIAQWPTVAGWSFEETDQRSVYFDPTEVPDRITDQANAEALNKIATRFSPPTLLEAAERAGRTTVQALGPCTPPGSFLDGFEDEDLLIAEMSLAAPTHWDRAIRASDAGLIPF